MKKPPQSGVYRIVVKRTDGANRYYIGQAVDLAGRWSSHITTLRKGKHFNKMMQRAYDKYGAEAISFEVLVICERDKYILTETEQKILDSYPRESVYNICLECVNSQIGVKYTPEQRLTLSLSHKGIMRSMEARISQGNTTRGRTHSAEHCKNMSLSQKGRPGKLWTPERKVHMTAIATGRKHSMESRELMRASSLKRERIKRERHEKEMAQNEFDGHSPIGDNCGESIRFGSNECEHRIYDKS